MFLADSPWLVFLTPFGIPIVAIIAVFTWLAIASISEAFAKVACHRNDADLKLELLARGFTAQEIVAVIESSSNAAATPDQPMQHTDDVYARRPGSVMT